MEFVEEYLKEVVNQPFPFGEKNKLTFEVISFKQLICEVIHFTLSKIRDIEHQRLFFALIFRMF